jgi:hypothetical protein
LNNVLPEDLRPVADFFGLPTVSVVAKDFYVVQAIKAVAATDVAPFSLAFGGGTALARAYKLIGRMSEDVDFKIVPPLHPGNSRSSLRKQLRALRDNVASALQEAGFMFNANDAGHVRSRNECRYIAYHIPYASDASEERELRSSLQVELTYSALRLPTTTLPVASFVAEAFQTEPEVLSVPCVSVSETAAEKLVALTRRVAAELAGLNRKIDPTLVRHIYDLHLIRKHIDLESVVGLARQIAADDAEMFKSQYPAYQDDITGEIRKAMTALRSNGSFRERYERFVALMAYGEKPPYSEAVETVLALAEKI